jgi:hypothetical protein
MGYRHLVEVIVEEILGGRKSCSHFWAGRLWVIIRNFIFYGRIGVGI